MVNKNKQLLLLLSLILLNSKTNTVFNNDFKLGLENISDKNLVKLRSQRIGLVTNQSGKDQQGRRNIDILRKHKLNITYIFAPEHGFKGTVGSEKNIRDSIDPTTNIPII
ncbi:MAG TPA: DUF1343 domain-containing protein, partial [Candidatus Dependentiae bacterium]|nr:DUF1343 domain-containing protein [Candidatus Dependentiae bacterium]